MKTDQIARGAARASGESLPPHAGLRGGPLGVAAAVCRLSGDLDLTMLAPARAQLEEALAARPTLLVVDLGDVEFCDSSGLSLLLQIRLDAEAMGVALRLAAMAPPVARVFEVTGTASVFSIYDSADEAARL
jgi:anti-anti-sigma factor